VLASRQYISKALKTLLVPFLITRDDHCRCGNPFHHAEGSRSAINPGKRGTGLRAVQNAGFAMMATLLVSGLASVATKFFFCLQRVFTPGQFFLLTELISLCKLCLIRHNLLLACTIAERDPLGSCSFPDRSSELSPSGSENSPCFRGLGTVMGKATGCQGRHAEGCRVEAVTP